jgi:hypothetical protein
MPSFIWALEGLMSYSDNTWAGFEVRRDLFEYKVTGPDVSQHPEIVSLMTDLGFPTKAAVVDPTITDFVYRFSILFAEDDGNTIEIGGSDGFRLEDEFHQRAVVEISTNADFIGYFAGNTDRFDGTYFLQGVATTPYPLSSNPRSMFGWMKPSAQNGSKGLFGYGSVRGYNPNDYNILLYITESLKSIKFYGSGIDSPDSNGVVINDWNFVGMVYDGLPGSYFSIIVNDRIFDSACCSLSTTGDVFQIGLGMAEYRRLDNVFNGDISCVSVFDRAVDLNYINDLRNAGIVNYDNMPLGLKYEGGNGLAQSGRETYKSGSLSAVSVDLGGVGPGTLVVSDGSSVLSDLFVSDKEYILENVKATNHELADQVIEVYSNGSLGNMTSSTRSQLPDVLLETYINGITIDDLETSQGVLDVRVVDELQVDNILISNGSYLEFRNANYIGPMSYWSLEENDGTRYDAVSNNHLEPVAVMVGTLLDQPMNGEPLYGYLFGQAEYDGQAGYVQLTPYESSKYGAIDYGMIVLDGKTKFSVEFDLYHNGIADSVYFYFYTNDIPLAEDSDNGGYVVYFDEWQSVTGVFYAGGRGLDVNTEFNFVSGEWYSVKIDYDNQIFAITINGVLTFSYDDSSVSRDLNGLYLGIAGRTGANSAIHRIRNLLISS